MNIECYNSDSILIEKGSYINSLDLLKAYYSSIDAPGLKAQVKVDEYYQPLRNGVWHFYTDSGKLFLNKLYDIGIVTDTMKVE